MSNIVDRLAKQVGGVTCLSNSLLSVGAEIYQTDVSGMVKGNRTLMPQYYGQVLRAVSLCGGIPYELLGVNQSPKFSCASLKFGTAMKFKRPYQLKSLRLNVVPLSTHYPDIDVSYDLAHFVAPIDRREEFFALVKSEEKILQFFFDAGLSFTLDEGFKTLMKHCAHYELYHSLSLVRGAVEFIQGLNVADEKFANSKKPFQKTLVIGKHYDVLNGIRQGLGLNRETMSFDARGITTVKNAISKHYKHNYALTSFDKLPLWPLQEFDNFVVTDFGESTLRMLEFIFAVHNINRERVANVYFLHPDWDKMGAVFFNRLTKKIELFSDENLAHKVDPIEWAKTVHAILK